MRVITDPGRDVVRDCWEPYVPHAEAPWDLRRVAHLHRRAGFAATWDELRRDLRDGPEASIDRLLSGRSRILGVPEEFERTAALLADAAVTSRDPARLKASWVYRMLLGPDPLGERLTLMWHDHFATSNLKVNDLAAMRRQNETLRRHARALFGALLNAAVRDGALLVWLDAPANRKGHPNENLARELMELFTVGVGNFSEDDVKQAARALTGWTTDRGEFLESPADHDGGEKHLFGRVGCWSGDDLLAMLLAHPATALRLARRVCGLLMGEAVVDADGVAALASGLRDHRLDIGWAVATVLQSRAFFARSNLGNRVLGPVEYVIGSARAMELLDPPPSTVVLAEWCADLGQDLFYPPNVGGWPGGRSWVTPRGMVGRANYATAVVEGEPVGLRAGWDPCALARRHGRGDDLDGVIAFHAELLLGDAPGPSLRRRLAAGLGSGVEGARHAVARLLASPEAQLA